jgi:hypothetical protein
MWLGLDWGSVPEWLAGLGSTAALGFAAYAAVATTRQLQMVEDDRRKIQASKVAAWCYTSSANQSPTYLVFNHSDLPIYRVELSAVDRRQPTAARSVVTSLSFLSPGEHHMEVDVGPLTAAANEKQLLVEIVFVDCAGARWQRNFEGQLRELR